MKNFKFNVGSKVRCNYPNEGFSGVVIGRGRYEKAAEEFRYTAGDRFYLIEITARGKVRSCAECYLVNESA